MEERVFKEWETKHLKQVLKEVKAKRAIGRIGDAAELTPAIYMIEQELKRRSE